MNLTENTDDMEPRVAAHNFCLTPKEAAGRARLSIDNFLYRCRLGTGPTCSGAKRLMRFKTSDVDSWVAAGFCK
jgi:hypothetical protein